MPRFKYSFVLIGACLAMSGCASHHQNIDTKKQVQKESQVTDEELMKSGQWRDPETGLIWMRCSVGQEWTGITCIAEPLKLTWDLAQDFIELTNRAGVYGKSNWQLPTIEELAALRKCPFGWEKMSSGETLMMKLPSGQEVPWQCANEKLLEQPVVDTDIFPNTLREMYWVNSDDVPWGYNDAWSIQFYHGLVWYSPKDNYFAFRFCFPFSA